MGASRLGSFGRRTAKFHATGPTDGSYIVTPRGWLRHPRQIVQGVCLPGREGRLPFPVRLDGYAFAQNETQIVQVTVAALRTRRHARARGSWLAGFDNARWAQRSRGGPR